YYLQATDLLTQIDGYTSESTNAAEEKLNTFYTDCMQHLVRHYRGMINRLYQKEALQLFAPVIDRIKKIQESAPFAVSKKLLL
ncbi:MAG: hypothetical protein ACK4IY_03555, partial [Chitinophagales bacterium]